MNEHKILTKYPPFPKQDAELGDAEMVKTESLPLGRGHSVLEETEAQTQNSYPRVLREVTASTQGLLGTQGQEYGLVQAGRS